MPKCHSIYTYKSLFRKVCAFSQKNVQQWRICYVRSSGNACTFFLMNQGSFIDGGIYVGPIAAAENEVLAFFFSVMFRFGYTKTTSGWW